MYTTYQHPTVPNSPQQQKKTLQLLQLGAQMDLHMNMPPQPIQSCRHENAQISDISQINNHVFRQTVLENLEEIYLHKKKKKHMSLITKLWLVECTFD